MDIYLIRHADAVPLGEQSISEDSERPLSDPGEAQSRALGEGFRRKGIILDHVVTSPFLRARQTANLLLTDWPAPVPSLVVCEDLVPDGKSRKVAKFLHKLGAERVGLVGHMPQLGNLAGWLIGSKKTQVDLAKSGAAHIVCGDRPGKSCGTLIWLVTPAWFE